jgi:excisionase family DNA binding protein
MTHFDEPLLRVGTVAKLLVLPEQQIRRLVREGIIPAIRCGRQLRFDPERLQEWAAQGGAGGWKRAPVERPAALPSRASRNRSTNCSTSPEKEHIHGAKI